MKLSANDRLDILDAIAQYNLAADEKDVEAMLAHYAEDGVIEGDMSTGRGKRAMRADLPQIFEMEGTLKRHLAVNVWFEPSDGGDRASVHYLLLVVEGETLPGVGATARVTDEFVREGGRWLVARHHVKVDPAMFNAIQQVKTTGQWPKGDSGQSE